MLLPHPNVANLHERAQTYLVPEDVDCCVVTRAPLLPQRLDASHIYDKGCLQAGEEWLERNLLFVAGVAVGVAFLQVSASPPLEGLRSSPVLGLVIAYLLARQVCGKERERERGVSMYCVYYYFG